MNIFLVMSTFSALLSPIVGIRAVLRGEFKPQRITRFIIWFVTVLFVGSLFSQGDRNGIFIALVQLLSSTALLLLSFRYGVGGTSKSDIVVLILALFTIYVWKTTHNPTLALYMSILSDLIGFGPTLVKSYLQPFSEDWKFYMCDVVAGGLNLLSLSSLEFKDFIFPLYIFLINTTSVAVILLGRHRVKRV